MVRMSACDDVYMVCAAAARSRAFACVHICVDLVLRRLLLLLYAALSTHTTVQIKVGPVHDGHKQTQTDINTVLYVVFAVQRILRSL